MTAVTTSKTLMTPPEVAERLGCNVHTVLLWIGDKELSAINLASRKATRPRWRVTEDALQAFLDRRSNTANATPARSRRRKAMEETPPDGFVDFFPEA